MKKLILTFGVCHVVLCVFVFSCSDNSECPEAVGVQKTEEQIIIKKYERNALLYKIADLDPIANEDEIKILYHEILVIDLDIQAKQDFINAIKESSSCV